MLYLSFYAGIQWATDDIYGKLEAANIAKNPVEVARVHIPHKTRNQNLISKETSDESMVQGQ